MFFVDFEEVGDWDAHLVGTPNKVSFLLIKLRTNAFSRLVELYCFFDRVRNLCEGLSINRVNKLFLLQFDLVCFVNFSSRKLHGLH